MKFQISYYKDSMTLSFTWGKHYKCLQCPFATWWKARKYFKRPRFKFYFGPMWKYNGKVQTKFGECDDYKYLGGYWPAASTEFLKWYTPKWFPIHILSWDIGWKDKYNSPRYERPGYFIIFFGRDYHKHWQFSMVVHAPKLIINGDSKYTTFEDNYWESMLWYLHYNKEYNRKHRNLYRARQTLQNHWTTQESTIAKKVEILDVRKDNLFDKGFVVITVKSKRLYNLCDSFPRFEHNKVSIPKFGVRSYYTLCNDNDVEIWFIESLHINQNLDKLQKGMIVDCEFHKTIDLGPTFRDDFLNKQGLKVIKDGLNKASK